MRVLAIDPGEKNIGIAISDPSGTIANPLIVLQHKGRQVDAAAIVQFAVDHDVELIIVGQALDEDGESTFQSRQAVRLGSAIQARTVIPVKLWDEGGSTKAAQSAMINMGVKKRKRRGHLDALAATYILQTFLDVQAGERQQSDQE